MSAFVPGTAKAAPGGSALPMRFALRELRGGLRGFVVFVACIALGVAAIAGIGSFAASLADGLAREGRTILGGDLAVTLIHREATATERAALERHGRVSVAATMRAMAQASAERMSLVEVKAVDDRYPLFGTVRLDPDLALPEALAAREEAFGAAAEPALLVRLGLSAGDRIRVGRAVLEIRATLRGEPDKLAGGIGFGPRLLIGLDALRATGLLQPGSLVRWHYRLQLPEADATDQAAEAVAAALRREVPAAGWEVRSRSNAAPALERNIERFTQFLTLVGLTALLVGGVGVANAVKGHLDRRRETIATLKALGATGGTVFGIYLSQVLMLAAVGIVLGLCLGAALPFAVTAALGQALPLPIEPALHGERLALAAVFGLLTALAFALWPLGRAHDVPVSALFREHVAAQLGRPRWRYVLLTAAVVAALVALAILLAYDRRIAAVFVAAAAAVFVLLRVVASALMLAARRAPRPSHALVRLALANIHRPGALTPTVVLSLGLGLAVLVTITQIDGNLRRQFIAAVPERAPSFFFVDVPAAEADAFEGFLLARAPSARIERVPMLRGRIVAANGIGAEKLNPAPHAAWVLQSDRGITYAATLPEGSRLAAGAWWEADATTPLVSFEKRVAEGLGLGVGDEVTVNVLGRNITARIANLRTVDWQTLGINFVMVFSPNTFRGAPHTHIATLTYPNGSTAEQEVELLKAVAVAFPTVTTVRVKEALEAVGSVVLNLALGIRGASAVTLLAAVLVLGGALAAGHRHRVYDAVILKTLGATRTRLLAAYALEYALLGLATAIFGVAAGSAAAFFVVRDIMHLSYVWLPAPALAAAGAALAVTVALGLVGTFTALGQKPGPVLRNL